jgi:hypothetical protein
MAKLIDDLDTRAVQTIHELACERFDWLQSSQRSSQLDLKEQLKWAKTSFECDHVILVSRSKAETLTKKRCHLICCIGKISGMRSQKFIADMIDGADTRSVTFRKRYHLGKSGALLTCGAVFAMKEPKSPAVDSYELALVMLSKAHSKPPITGSIADKVTFTTYDEFILKLLLGEIGLEMRHEHGRRRELWDDVESQDHSYGSGVISQSLVLPGRHLLEYEYKMGFHTDAEVMAKWLNAELRGFRDGMRKIEELDRALRDAKDWLGHTCSDTWRASIDSSLLGGYLELLTDKGKPALLSDRIKEARKLSGIDEGGN